MFGEVKEADTLCTDNSSINWDRIFRKQFCNIKIQNYLNFLISLLRI